MSLYDEFISEYDDGSLEFNDLHYRTGAAITVEFGIADGFAKKENGELEWGYIRLHTGVDRANGRTVNGVRDAIISPFNFDKSNFMDFNGKSYGSMITLINTKYGFKFRIAHMFPKEIIVIDKLKNNEPIKRNEILGPTGNYGISTGAHTHTEVISIEEKSEVLERILLEKYNDVEEQYSDEFISAFYRTKDKFKDATFEEIKNDWMTQKSKRRAFFVNKYLYRYIDYDGNLKTRYSTNFLWNGL